MDTDHRLQCWCVLVSTSLLLCTVPALSQRGYWFDDLLATPFATAPIIDGNISEWPSRDATIYDDRYPGGGYRLDFPTFHRIGGQAHIGTGHMMIGWSETRDEIYLALQWFDSPVWDPANPWSLSSNDLMTILVDVDGGQASEQVIDDRFQEATLAGTRSLGSLDYDVAEEDGDSVGSTQAWVINPGARSIHLWGMPQAWVSQQPFAEVAVSSPSPDEDGNPMPGYVLEARIPMWNRIDVAGPSSSNRAELSAGSGIRLGFALQWLHLQSAAYVDLWVGTESPQDVVNWGQSANIPFLTLVPASPTTGLLPTTWGLFKEGIAK